MSRFPTAPAWATQRLLEGLVIPAHPLALTKERKFDERPDAIDKVVQGVAVLSEDDQLPSVSVGIEHFGVVLEQPGQFFPFLIAYRLTNLCR